MSLIARILLFVPAMITGFFVSTEDYRYWFVAFGIALVLLAAALTANIYLPDILSNRQKRRDD